MAKMTWAQVKKYNEEMVNGWQFSVQNWSYWGEKTAEQRTEQDKNGVLYEATLRYREERIGEGWKAESTGRQIVFLTVDRLTETESSRESADSTCRMYHTEHIGEKQIGEPQSRKMFSYIQKLTKTLDFSEILAEFLPKDQAEPQDTITENTQEESEEPAEVEEISTEETEEPTATAAAFPDMFVELAKAYITGKQTPKKPQTAPKAEKAEGQPQEAEEPQEEPEKEPEPIGYHGEASDILTAEEVEKLTSGEQVHKGEKWAKRTYICTPYTAGSYLVYTISGENIEPGRDAKYAGFIANGAYYQDMEVIRAKFADDIDRELKDRIPTEEAARVIFETLEPDSYEWRNIDSYLNYDHTREAQSLFFEDKKPDLRLYGAGRDISTAEIIHYILDAENAVKDLATAYAESHKADIYKNWIDYTRTAAKYAEIVADKGSEPHTLKKISKSIGNQKTVRILLVNGNEIKVDANAVKHISSWGYISDYSVQASDRQYIDRNEYGRAKDITAADIKQITHGGRVLYSAA